MIRGLKLTCFNSAQVLLLLLLVQRVSISDVPLISVSETRTVDIYAKNLYCLYVTLSNWAYDVTHDIGGFIMPYQYHDIMISWWYPEDIHEVWALQRACAELALALEVFAKAQQWWEAPLRPIFPFLCFFCIGFLWQDLRLCKTFFGPWHRSCLADVAQMFWGTLWRFFFSWFLGICDVSFRSTDVLNLDFAAFHRDYSSIINFYQLFYLLEEIADTLTGLGAAHHVCSPRSRRPAVLTIHCSNFCYSSSDDDDDDHHHHHRYAPHKQHELDPYWRSWLNVEVKRGWEN